MDIKTPPEDFKTLFQRVDDLENRFTALTMIVEKLIDVVYDQVTDSIEENKSKLNKLRQEI